MNKSLVVAERSSQTVRFRLLETIRQFATDKLIECDGETRASELRRLHAEHFLDLCETAAPRAHRAEPRRVAEAAGPRARQSRCRVRLLRGGPRRVRRRSSSSAWPRPTTSAPGLNRTPIDFLQDALDRDASCSPGLRAKALVTLARLMNAILPSEQSHESASALCLEAIELSRREGDVVDRGARPRHLQPDLEAIRRSRVGAQRCSGRARARASGSTIRGSSDSPRMPPAMHSPRSSRAGPTSRRRSSTTAAPATSRASASRLQVLAAGTVTTHRGGPPGGGAGGRGDGDR